MSTTTIIISHKQINIPYLQDLLAKHEINGIFLLFDAALLSQNKEWVDFIQKNNLNVTICAAAAERRNIKAAALPLDFRLGSIGELVENCDQANEVISI